MENATQTPASSEAQSGEFIQAPFSQITVQITKAEHIDLKWQGQFWKGQHTQLKQKYEKQTQELEFAKAKIRDLKQRLYGKKCEKKGTAKQDTANGNRSSSTRSRGQQQGSKGHGRTSRPDLAVIEEVRDVAPEDQKCSICGLAHKLLAQTEDSTIIEIEVQAHTRLIKRKMYVKACQCEGVPRIITAPPAPRLIPKGGIGISIWTEVLINKFLFSRATYNLCTDYGHRGLPLAPGTLTGGLKRIAPLFEPLINLLIEKQLTEALFHNDETGWKVFEAVEGKANNKWFLWVTRSPSVVFYTMAPSRSGDIPIEYFSGLDKTLEQVIVVCDRYSGYKRLARVNEVILLAFCWAHVRRDFLDAARSWPDLEAWMFSWVEMIGELYALNAQRKAHWDETKDIEEQSTTFLERHQVLEQAITKMGERCRSELEKESLRTEQSKILDSLENHWQGLTVFVNAPQVPMDNNVAERCMRNPGMGRKNYYGSGSQWSAELAAMMFSLFQTMLLWKLNPHHWLFSYLTACAENGGQAPKDLSPFIPWQMSEERLQKLSNPLSDTAPPKINSPPEPP